MDKIQKILIKIGRKDLAQEYFEKVSCIIKSGKENWERLKDIKIPIKKGPKSGLSKQLYKYRLLIDDGYYEIYETENHWEKKIYRANKLDNKDNIVESLGGVTGYKSLNVAKSVIERLVKK